MKTELQNDYAKRKNNYPNNIVEAYHLLNNYNSNTPKQNNNRSNNKREGISFHQNKKDIKCYKCGQKGHISPNCPNNNNNNNNNTQHSHAQVENNSNNSNTNNNNNNNSNSKTEVQHSHFQMESNNTHFGFLMIEEENNNEMNNTNHGNNNIHVIDTNFYNNKETASKLRDWILLDNQSTTDVFCNNNLLNNIRSTNESLKMITNGGEFTTQNKGTLKNYGDVWYDNKAVTNILSLANMVKKYRVTYDSAKGDRFVVHKPDSLVYFNRSKNGLYYHDTKQRDLCLLNTVKENETYYTQRQIERAKLTRKIYGMVGYPSIKDFKNMVLQNLINNCPINTDESRKNIWIRYPCIKRKNCKK